MKKSLKLCLCLLMLGSRSIAQAQEAAPYVLTQSINNVPIEKVRCIDLLRNIAQINEEEPTIVQQLADNIVKLNQTVEEIVTQFNETNDAITQFESMRQQAVEQHLLVVETVYNDYRNQGNDFERLSEDEQLVLLKSNEQVQEWQQALDKIDQQLNASIAQRDQLEKQHQQLLYELDTQTSQLEQYKLEHSQLNQCILYPYSTQREYLGQLLINQQVTNLQELLVNLDTYLQRMVPLAYRKVHFDEIATLFSAARSAEEIEIQLYGKPVIELDDYGREYYTYARELNSWDIEILANLALRDYFVSKDTDQLYNRYNEVLTIKEGQFAYFYAMNQESFEQMKQLLAEYLNAHQLWDSNTVAQLKAFHERYQMKLVLFDESSQQWYKAPGQESGYYQLYATRDLMQQLPTESSMSGMEHSIDEQPHEANSSRLDKIKEKLKRSSNASTESEKSLSKPKRNKASDESITSSSSVHTEQQSRSKPKESTKKSSEKSKKFIRTDLPNAESASESTKSKDENKRGINLPSAGEQAFILWLAIAMLTVGISILIWDIYLRYKKRKALEKIKLD